MICEDERRKDVSALLEKLSAADDGENTRSGRDEEGAKDKYEGDAVTVALFS